MLKKGLKLDRKTLRNYIYPIMLVLVIFVSLIIFYFSLRFLIKSISTALFMGSAETPAPSFQNENLKYLKRYIPDLPLSL
ncbi:MAG: hypothetical protein A3A80_00080 [Candidatus Terrybacteria bacterium RIFCSPLOWO2_01_FULL_44_24]|uniref:Uncharacterized protein n=1 Tax=Candidatus Terrybacteria bacterium RIFCSPHIGHO2_01_FULL_43_35 TaxID=1802361 RepID=A0A1G2PG98_9BACT|nr:MAG: hypothetical protein A2828_03445 [Candidatus Terrybacteria bacterium RIFCSPHIGHO2_01_FULL_43_35]OHA50460.1 MAG: hypothetical protein A3B75_00915 [Candidatus Terrybacteria bacterium RIFCSPHIGHO2_02_FULL_43_14]OHA51082.1 MAG: hypothetical protein A3A80_00080 [Candidatus Terrybacteria bacterium RIFCSPLOWO2_01_FULL_44_24]